ncbi:MAG: heparinase, partial [Bacteroidota bacterium]
MLSFLGLFLAVSLHLHGQSHPNLILTQEGVETIQKTEGNAPLFERVLQQTQAEVEAEIAAGIFVPVPKDMAGGYTHERHKKNFFVLQKAGNLYQITGEEKYAVYVRDVFLEYAKLFPTLGLHPTQKSYATGKIFWQCLNDANWLVYCSQAYDCIYDFLTQTERENLETNLFRPLADFISIENPKFFNRIHNHSTWGNAAVGM